MRAAAWCAWAALYAGCGCFRDPHELTTFRVLGVQADPPVPAPGQQVALTLATADTHPRPVQVAWYHCPPGQGGVTHGPNGLTTNVDACLRQTPFAMGVSVTDTIPTDPSLLDGGVNLAGFACAGGTIGPPSDGTAFPSCNGGDAQGWVFRRTVSTAALGDAGGVTNPEITEVRFGSYPSLAPIDLAHPPVVPHCQPTGGNAPCPQYRIELALSGLSGPGNTYHLDFVVDLATLYPQGAECPTLEPAPGANAIAWMPPDHPGTAHFFIFVHTNGADGFAWTERDVVVQ